MDSTTFFFHLADNIFLFLCLIFFSVLAFIPILKKVSVGFFDPSTIAILGSAFAFATGIFVFYVDDYSQKYLFSFLTCEAAFWLGVVLFTPSANKINSHFRKLTPLRISSESRVMTWMLFFVYVSLKLMQYYFIGIPIFAVVRIGMAVNSGGYGFFQTASNLIFPLCLFGFFVLAFSGKEKKVAVAIGLTVFSIFLFLDGSKSALVPIFQTLYLSMLICGGKHFLTAKTYERKYFFLIVLIIIIMAVLTVFLKEQDFVRSLLLVGFRFAAYGDTYFYSYPNNVIEKIQPGGFIETLFFPVLSTLRIVDSSEVPFSLGALLSQAISDFYEGGGPNARHNIISFLYFGNMGFIFSFILGAVIGLIRKFVFINSRDMHWSYVAILALFLSAPLFTDAPFGISLLFMSIITWFFWLIISKILNMSVRARISKYKV